MAGIADMNRLLDLMLKLALYDIPLGVPLQSKIDDHYKPLIPVLYPASRTVEASTVGLVSQIATMYRLNLRHTLANISVAFENGKDPLIPDLNISTQISGHVLL